MTTFRDGEGESFGSELLSSLGLLSRAVVKRASSGISRIEMLQSISEITIGVSRAAVTEWWLKEGHGYFRCAAVRQPTGCLRWEVDNIDVTHPDEGIIVGTREQQALNRVYLDLIASPPAADGRPAADRYLWICGSCSGCACWPVDPEQARRWRLEAGDAETCFVLIPIRGEDEYLGFVSFKNSPNEHFNHRDVEFMKLVAEIVTVGLVHQAAQFKLRERLKELHCLYAVARLADDPELTLDEVLVGLADLLPNAWQYPEKAAGRVALDGREYCTSGFTETTQMQSAEIVVGGSVRGSIDVVYIKERPWYHEGPFLEEERNLLDTLAREVSGIIERRQARDDKEHLETQLRHADRLATIGQMAAGVAHELNEPLGNILGFAQLAMKSTGAQTAVHRDLEKIIEACLHSRRVVSKLKLLARQMPTQYAEIDVNKMIVEDLFFIETRCTKQGVRIVEDLDPGSPRITADPGQLYQVLVNLTVNAIQAMPDGGTLTISTRQVGGRVVIGVADTGCGMTTDVLDKIFLPFFTTKASDEGTGLGLSVVQGIVSSHGGEILVYSEPGRGTRFDVILPIDGAATGNEG
jgi:signal transduction histidine kinase